MGEESTTPDLVELSQQAFDAGSRHDIDAIMEFHAPDAAWDLSDLGLGTFDGAAAIRDFVEDWFATWQDLVLETEEIVDLGRGVVFAPVREEGRPTASGGHVEQRRGWVTLWVKGNITRIVIYLDIDQARAAAERLAEERGWAVSENVDLVRSIYADWERGDYGSVEWAHPEIEVVIADGPSPGRWSGLAGMAEAARDLFSAWDDVRAESEEYRALDRDEVLVLDHRSGRGTTSGLELGQMRTQGATLWRVRDGRMTRLVVYWDRERAFADLGLQE